MNSLAQSVHHRGITLIDMLMTIAILAVVAAVAVPALSGNDQLRIRAAGDILQSDIEFAQTMTIAHPADPVVLLVVPAQGQWYLAHESDTSTPLVRPDTGEPYVVTLGEGRARMATGVGIQTTNMPVNQMTFDPVGGLKYHTSSPELRLSMSGVASSPRLRLAVHHMTGTITRTWDMPGQQPAGQAIGLGPGQ